MTDMTAADVNRLVGQLPHCDTAVLHAPGSCTYCDRHPEWQALRQAWGIAYTGQWPADGQLPCPSDARRGTGGAHTWGGNTPRPHRAYWTSPGTWTDPDCIECGGEGAPCCDPPTHPYAECGAATGGGTCTLGPHPTEVAHRRWPS